MLKKFVGNTNGRHTANAINGGSKIQRNLTKLESCSKPHRKNLTSTPTVQEIP